MVNTIHFQFRNCESESLRKAKNSISILKYKLYIIIKFVRNFLKLFIILLFQQYLFLSYNIIIFTVSDTIFQHDNVMTCFIFLLKFSSKAPDIISFWDRKKYLKHKLYVLCYGDFTRKRFKIKIKIKKINSYLFYLIYKFKKSI